LSGLLLNYNARIEAQAIALHISVLAIHKTKLRFESIKPHRSG